MRTESTNPALCSFEGRSNQGKTKYAFLSGRPKVRQLWSSFAANCEALDQSNSGVVRYFLHMAVAPEAVSIMDAAGDAFLLEPESMKAWFQYFKNGHYHNPGFRRLVLHVAVYAVRYMIDLHPDAAQFSDAFLSIVRSKGFATFILDRWTGNGITSVMTTSDETRYVIKEFCFKNRDLARVYCDYFESGIASVRAAEFNAFADEFEDSLGDWACGIKGYGDFSEVTLLEQAAYFRNKYIALPETKHKAMRHLLGFYRFLINTPEGCGIFNDSNFSPTVIKSNSVMRYISEGWAFIQYNDIPLNERQPRQVVLLRDVHLPTTRYIQGDAIVVDVSIVESEFYRNLIWRYIKTSISNLLSAFSIRYIAEALHIVEQAKKDDHKRIGLLTDSEAYAVLTNFLNKDSMQDNTVIQAMAVLRRFFEWASRVKHLELESELTIGYLFYRKENKDSGTRRENIAILHEDLDRILGRLRMEAEMSYRGLVMLTFVKILATTPFRPSQICQMQASKIQLYEEDGICFIKGVKKMTRGDKTESVTHPSTFYWIKELMEKSEDLRERCYDKDLEDLIFIYEDSRGFVRVEEADVRAELDRVCKILEMPVWTPYNIRKFFATIADELDRQLGYHGEMAAQVMDHQSYKTTSEHYVDRTFEEFDRTEVADKIGTDESMEEEYERLKKGENI